MAMAETIGREVPTMRCSPWIAAMLACVALAAGAQEVDFSAKSRALSSLATARTTAPFANGHEPGSARESIPLRFDRALGDARPASSACERSTLCYEAAEGRIVYRGARDYMPRIGELAPESVSLRAHRIVFRYSF